MKEIGLYSPVMEFTTQNAGSAQWCIAEKDGKKFFIKKFLSPVYPAPNKEISPEKYEARMNRFHQAEAGKKALYYALSQNNDAGILLVPEEVFPFRFHLCTAAPYISGNLEPGKICRLSEWQRLDIMKKITLGVQCIHRAGVVHSDLKVENVVFSQDGCGECSVKIIDFDGSFFEKNPPENAEDLAGDFTYFAPEAYEMAMGKNVKPDRRIDIFALGVLFHYLWCGRFPEKPDDRTIGEHLLAGGALRQDASIPADLWNVLRKMLEKNPDQRADLYQVYSLLHGLSEKCPKTRIILSVAENRNGLPGQTEVPAEKKADAPKEKSSAWKTVVGFVIAGIAAYLLFRYLV